MLDIIYDTLIDSIKLLPFLFITYLLMEYLEHKTSRKSNNFIKKAGKFGPLYGSLLGIIPQCGFSAAASNLYAGRVISLGTLIAIFLSTSDELLPILISEAAPINTIIKILLVKLIIGIIAGFLIDLSFRNNNNSINNTNIKNICEHEHCHCNEERIFKSSLKHTFNIFFYIIIISFIINTLIYIIGEENLSNFIMNKPIIGPILSGIIGLIPNCASSVIITKLYLSNVINVSTMIAGLLVGSGVGILILFKVNNNLRENIKITSLLYITGVIFGILLEIINLQI